MNMFNLFIIVCCIAFAGVTCFLGLRMKKRYVKYIPAAIAALISLGFFIKVRYYSQGFEDLGYAVLLIVSLLCTVVSGIAALAMEFIRTGNR